MSTQMRCLPSRMLVVLILTVLVIIPVKQAFAYIQQMAFDELVHLADIVFIGTVVEKKPHIAENRRMVKTKIVFGQIEIIHQKDSIMEKIGNRIALTYSGGRFNEAVTYISDTPRIETGTRYMVFAYYDGQEHANPFVGGEQGLFRIVVDEVTGEQYPARVSGSGIADVRGDRVRLTRPLKKIRNGLPEWKEPFPGIKRAPPPEPRFDVDPTSRSAQSTPPETFLNIGSLKDQVRETLGESPRAAVQQKLQKRAAAALSRKAASVAPALPKRHAWEFSPDGKVVILDPDKVKCRTPQDKTAASTGVLNSSRTPMGGSSWEDISIYGWADLPVILTFVPESCWWYISDHIAAATYNTYIDDLIRYRDYDGGCRFLNGYSEMCGFLTDSQENDVFVKGWEDAIARTHYSGGTCPTCQFWESDIAFKAEETWTTDHTCQLYRNVPGSPCMGARLYLKTAVHEMGHTLGLMIGGEDYKYDIPTVMNGGLENAVENGRGLHVGDTYLLRYWYADQRGPGKMNYDDIGIESWIAQGGTVNATTDKALYSPGEQIVIRNITVENIGRNDAPDVRVRAYLSEDVDLFSLHDIYNQLDLNKIPAGGLMKVPPADVYYQWPTFEAETFWTGDLKFMIPSDIPTGTYRVHLVVTANNDQSVRGPADGDTSYHEKTVHNNHTFLYYPVEITCPKPAAPANFKEQGTDEDGVGLAWDEVPGAQYYRILRNTTDDLTSATVLTGTLASNSYKDTTAVPAIRYYYWIVAKSACLAVSDPTRVMGLRPLAAPCIESATDGLSAGEVKITAKRVDMGNYFCFYYNTVNDPDTAKMIDGACWTSDSTASHTGATPGQTYYYFAKAALASNGQNASARGSGACPDNMGWRRLSPPTAVNASQSYDSYIDVSWFLSPGASAYRLYRSTEPDPATAVPVSAAWTDQLVQTDWDVEAGKPYYYWVRAALNILGDSPSDLSTAYAAGTKAYLPAPKVEMGNFGASDGTYATKVTIAWNPVTWPQETYYYRVYRGEVGVPGVWDSGVANQATALSGWQLETSFDDTTAVPGKDYWYWVSSALSSTGLRESAWWLCPSCIDSGWRKLLPAATVTASDGEFSDRIRVTWAPVDGVTYYRVYRSTDILDTAPALVSPVVTGTQFDDTDAALVARTTYYYWVTSVIDAAGNRESSLSRTGSSGWKEVQPPLGVTATSGVYTDRIQVAWSPAGGDVRYKIYRSTTNDPSTAKEVSAYLQRETSYDDLYANPGRVYYYWITVRPYPCKDCIISPYSAVAGGYRAIVPPTGVQASDNAYQDKVVVTWDAASGGPYYKVYRNTTNDFRGATAVSAWQTALTFNDTTDLKIGVVYYYFVLAANDQNGARQSDPGTGDAGSRALAPPVNVMATQGVFYRSIGVNWNPGAKEATHFRVYRSQDWQVTTAQPISGWQIATYFDDASVSPGVTYYYWVTEAIDAAGTLESALSPAAIGAVGYAFGEIPGDIDGNRKIELNDAILALQVVTGTIPQLWIRSGTNPIAGATIRKGADINSDGKIGLAEAIYILRTMAFPEEPPNGE